MKKWIHRNRRVIRVTLAISFCALLSVAWVYESRMKAKFARDYVQFFEDTAAAFEAHAQQPEMDRLQDRGVRLGMRLELLDMGEDEEERFLRDHNVHVRNSYRRAVKAALGRGEGISEFWLVTWGLSPTLDP